MIDKELKLQVQGLVAEYKKAKNLYDKAGLDAALKTEALQGMANALQLQQVAISNYANWMHILRQENLKGSSEE